MALTRASDLESFSVGVPFMLNGGHDVSDQLSFSSNKQRVNSQLPVVEDGLGESLSTGGLTKSSVETERLGDREVCLHGVHGGTNSLLGREDVSTSNVETRLYRKLILKGQQPPCMATYS